MDFFAWRLKRRAVAATHMWVLVISAVLFIAIVVLEHAAPANVVIAYGFVLPILLIATAGKRWWMIVTVLLSLAATYAGLLQPTKPGRFVSSVINRTVVAGVLVGVAYFAMTREERKAREQAAQAELVRANNQLVQVKDALNRSERLAALGLLASSVAHEVGTPLHSIGWQLQSLSDDPGATPDMKKTIGLIETELDRVVRIVKDKLSSIHRPKTARGPLQLNQVVESVVALMRPSFLGKGVTLKMDLGGQAAGVQGSSEQIRQVLINLLTNALAATEAGGDVMIVVGRRAATLSELEDGRRAGLHPVATRVTVTVRDTGCGIEGEYLQRVFEPFFTTKAIGDGTGLGLFLSREIIIAHGGTLSIESVIRKGTIVEVALPVESDPSRQDETDEQVTG